MRHELAIFVRNSGNLLPEPAEMWATRSGGALIEQRHVAWLPRSIAGSRHPKTRPQEAIDFATSGSPKTYTSVHGYDRTSYNVPKGEQNDHDNWEAGVVARLRVVQYVAQ